MNEPILWNDQSGNRKVKGQGHTRPGGGIILDPFGRVGLLICSLAVYLSTVFVILICQIFMDILFLYVGLDSLY